MAHAKKEGSYEMVLEGRHLLGVFFAVVLLCAVFFSLGFVLGRNQVVAQKPSGTATPESAPSTESPGPAATDLSFYDRVEGKEGSDALQPAKQPAGPEAKPSAPPSSTASAPPAAGQPIYLQVAALTQEPDAKRLAQEIIKLGFPVVIRPPREDRFYRVQVGPFENDELATAAQRRLEAQGFRDIVRR